VAAAAVIVDSFVTSMITGVNRSGSCARRASPSFADRTPAKT
jgi:hypothetical protein